MPEEINRVLTDRLSDFLFTHSPEAAGHLEREGIAAERVHFVGNTMIDSLRKYESRARLRRRWLETGVEEGGYLLITLHRPSNVDDPARLNRIVDELMKLGRHFPSLFPVHPRTLGRLEADGRLDQLEQAGVRCIPPVGYLDFLSLQIGAGAILTDSGGVQEEASALGVACYTFRPNTERPVTITQGTNTLLLDDPAAISAVRLDSSPHAPCAIPLWDGHAADRVVDVIASAYDLGVLEATG
jgi:UDP-N-acetylglucosamine 2-epimerase (non-hydrolysing)